jgi:glycosyltransferase involved in cell wall biosynthesis
MTGAEASLGAHRAPLRLTLVTHYFPSHRGGVELAAWEIASHLARAGIAEVTWWASDTDAAPRDVPGLRCVAARACNLFERRLGFPFPLWSPAALLGLVRSVRASDVVHLHDCVYFHNVVAWAASRLYRRPVVVTQHVGLVPYRNPVPRALLAAANRAFGRLVLGGAAQSIFVSEVVRRYFARFVRFRKPPLRIANGVDLRVFVPVDDERRAALRAKLGADGAPVLLFVGRFVEKKGLRLLKRLALSLPQARWIFAGWGPLDPEHWGLANVSVSRNLTKEQLVPLYQAADLLVLPSVGEGFPLVVQEAMACGTPALVSSETAAGCPEAAGVLLSESLAGDDVATRWSARVEALLASPESLRSLRTRVAEFARASWSWERCAEAYGEVLQGCAARQ